MKQPGRISRRVCLTVLAVALCVFALFVADLMLHGPLNRIDPLVSDWFQAHAHPLFTQLLFAITHVHGTIGIWLFAAVAAAWLAARREMQWLKTLAFCVPGGLLLNAATKLVFMRARPTFDHPLVELSSASFPSGHTAGATVWWGFALVVLWSVSDAKVVRVSGAGFALAMIGLTALSRVYLGAHYASDVLAAMAEGVGWLALGFLCASRFKTRE